jgi:hypothetical protein
MERKSISVFDPRMICGEEVEPFCLPTSNNEVSQLLAAGTNLFWWAMHEALADGKVDEARMIGKVLVDIVGRELSDANRKAAERLIDETIDNNSDNDFNPSDN